ncbi:MAG: N(5)-(carboxyethyl)ornithine synthase [Ornithinibacter sp.]
MGRSKKENEHRLALHPAHLERVPVDLRQRMYLEAGYGERFGVGDDELRELVAGVRSHEQLVEQCDVILQPKPLHADVAELRAGQVLWGWPHCVQDLELTQLAVDRRLTVIAFEAMNHWKQDDSFDLHVFHGNNELAGYASVLHALTLAGTTGNYGPRRSAVVLGFGATARGAVTALTALGIGDVDVLTHRQVAAVASPIHSARILHFQADDRVGGVSHVVTGQGRAPLAEFLGEHDIIVNCVLQDTDNPLVFLTHDDLPELSPGAMVIDVSCDEGMGFEWSRPTTFAEPTFTVGRNIMYYAVDHSPSYLWASATWEISEALLPFLRTVMEGPGSWDQAATVRRAIEIRDGVIQNPAILSFQGRGEDYPHEVLPN